jgi:hypothetical protein
VLQSLPQQVHHVQVVERVEDHAALAARADEPQPPQQAQLVRHRRLRERQHGREIADAELAVRQRVEDAHARWIAQRAEGVGQAGDRVATDQRRAQPPHAGQVDLDDVAGVSRLEHMSRCSYVSRD